MIFLLRLFFLNSFTLRVFALLLSPTSVIYQSTTYYVCVFGRSIFSYEDIAAHQSEMNHHLKNNSETDKVITETRDSLQIACYTVFEST